MQSKAEITVRERLANNGRNTANSNAGIRVGSDLHLCEMLIAEIDRQRTIIQVVADNLGCGPENLVVWSGKAKAALLELDNLQQSKTGQQ